MRSAVFLCVVIFLSTLSQAQYSFEGSWHYYNSKGLEEGTLVIVRVAGAHDQFKAKMRFYNDELVAVHDSLKYTELAMDMEIVATNKFRLFSEGIIMGLLLTEDEDGNECISLCDNNWVEISLPEKNEQLMEVIFPQRFFRPWFIPKSISIQTSVAISAQALSSERYYDYGAKPKGDRPGGWALPTVMDNSFTPIKVSSTLPAQGKYSYDIAKAFDDNPTTAWVPKGDGKGNFIGEFIEFVGVVLNEKIYILNGLQASKMMFDANARVRKLDVYVNEKYYGQFELLDQMGEQWIDLPLINEFQKSNGNTTIRFVIQSIYEGIKYPDVCITEIFTRGG